MNTLKYEDYLRAADYVKSRLCDIPQTGIILGTGLGGFAEEIKAAEIIDYAVIPGFPVSTNQSHAGKLISGYIDGKYVVCMSGRFHRYEGYSYELLSFPIRLFKLLGVKSVIITNAAGAVNPEYKPGDIMLIKDHIKLNGDSPMSGANIPQFGERFFDVTDMYTASMRSVALRQAQKSPLNIHEGVYMFFTGPQFETPAEIRAARILGADAVGMSTVTEALTAAHCNMPLLALSVITNMAAGVIPNKKINDDEVGETASVIAADFKNYVRSILAEL